MVTPELVGFVRTQLQQGVTADSLRQTLTTVGWSADDVADALTAARGGSRISLWTNPAVARVFELSFRFGFAALFLVAAAQTLLKPEVYAALIRESTLVRIIGSTQPLLWLIFANDLALGLVILIGKWRPVVYAWAGLWLLAVTYFRVLDLVAL